MMLSSLVTVAQSDDSPPIEAFYPPKSLGGLALSPSGRYLAFPDYRHTHDVITIIDLKTMTEVNRVREGFNSFTWVRWASEDRLVAGVRYYIPGYIKSEGKKRDETGKVAALQRVYIQRVVSFDRDGFNRLYLFNDAKKSMKRYVNLARIEDILPNDPDHILMPAFDGALYLWKVNIRTGAIEKVERGTSKTRGWDTNKQGRAVFRYDLSKNGKHMIVKARPPSDEKWQTVARLRPEDQSLFEPIAATDDPNIYLVAARRKNADKTALYRYDLYTNQMLDKVADHEAVDIHGGVFDNRGNFLGAVFENSRREYVFLDSTLQSHYEGLLKFMGPDVSLSVQDITEDGSKWLLYVSGPKEPGSFYVYDAKTRSADFLVSKNYDLEPEQLGSADFISYEARDGLQISGLHTKAVGNVGTKAPLIILPHGGPQARTYFGHDRMVQYLASRGYQIFEPNFRGSRGFGQRFERAGYRQWGLAMQNDISDAVKHFVETGQVEHDEVCIMGMSYGGYAALMGAIQTPNLFQCAISVNGVADLESQIKYNLDKYKDIEGLQTLIVTTIGDPNKDKDMIKSVSPIMQSEKLSIPLLLMHGEMDQVVPVDQSRRLAEKLEAQGHNFRYIELPKANHNLRPKEPDEDISEDFLGIEDVVQIIEAFLQQHLPVD